MPVWAWIAIGAGAVVLVAAAVVATVFGLRFAERRYLLRLISRREAIGAARQGLEDVVMRLATASDEHLEHFASDPDAIERRALHEVASRARMLADELDSMPLPNKIVPAAEALGDAAWVIGREAGRVHDERTGDAAFEELGSIDLAEVTAVFHAASARVAALCDECGLDEESVYGGGLYL